MKIFLAFLFVFLSVMNVIDPLPHLVVCAILGVLSGWATARLFYD